MATIGSTQIRVYPDDTKKHKRPHFHAASPDSDVVIGLPELDVIAGSVRNLHDVIAWAIVPHNLVKVLDAWDLGNPTMPTKRP
jgi:hypothetical protein